MMRNIEKENWENAEKISKRGRGEKKIKRRKKWSRITRPIDVSVVPLPILQCL